MSDDVVEINTKGLDKLLKAFSGEKVPSIKVGILGDKDARADGNGNANVGLRHEFGTENLPERSFLRIPLTKNLDKFLKQAGAFDKDMLKEVMRTGTLLDFMKKVSVVAEDVVLDAFDTGGNGEWKASNMKHKKNKQTLVETQQLRNSITSVVEE